MPYGVADGSLNGIVFCLYIFVDKSRRHDDDAAAEEAAIGGEYFTDDYFDNLQSSIEVSSVVRVLLCSLCLKTVEQRRSEMDSNIVYSLIRYSRSYYIIVQAGNYAIAHTLYVGLIVI